MRLRVSAVDNSKSVSLEAVTLASHQPGVRRRKGDLVSVLVHRPSPDRRGRARPPRGGGLVRGPALALAAALALGAVPVLTQAAPAEAMVTAGAGFILPNPYRMSNVGAYRAPDGSLVYCLEWGKESPSLPTDPEQKRSVTNSYRDWGEVETGRVAWLIAEHGQTEDRVKAATVAVAIWQRHPGTIDPFTGENEFFVQAIGDDALRKRILAEARKLGQAMDKITPVAPRPGGTLTVTPDPQEPAVPGGEGSAGPDAAAHEGTVTLAGLPTGATGTLSLNEGAEFLPAKPGEDASSSLGGVTGNRTLRYRAAPSDQQLSDTPVEATGAFTLPGGSAGFSIALWRTGGEFQDMAGAGERIREQRFTLRGEASSSVRFAPELSTAVPQRVVDPGEPLRDRVTARLAEGSRPWRTLSDGSYLPITAECSLYGPTLAAPEEQETVPEDARLAAGPVRVTLGGGHEDPTNTPVELDFDGDTAGAGFYTAVCGIDAAAQEPEAHGAALPEGYRFQDRYGLAEETQLRPMALRLRTQLSAETARPGADIDDVIEASVENAGPLDGRLVSGGDTVDIPLQGTLYWSAERPEQSSLPPENAEIVGEARATLLADQDRVTSPLSLPDREGWVSVRWCTDPAETVPDEPGLVEAWCDDYGVPAETVHLVSPPPPEPTPTPESRSAVLAATGGEASGSAALIGASLATLAAGAGLLPLARKKNRHREG